MESEGLLVRETRQEGAKLYVGAVAGSELLWDRWCGHAAAHPEREAIVLGSVVNGPPVVGAGGVWLAGQDGVLRKRSLEDGAAGSGCGFPWASRPAISGNGRSVAFESWAPGLAQPDLNRARDVFASLVDAAVDTDGDGIPDEWMIQHFGHPAGQASDLSRAEDDADGDGLTNLAEYIAGTDPNDAASLLGIEISIAATPDSVTVSWPAAPGRVYRVQYKDNLTDPVWLEAGGSVLVIGNQAQFTTSATQPQRFYRVIATD